MVNNKPNNILPDSDWHLPAIRHTSYTMNTDQYVDSVIARCLVDNTAGSAAYLAAEALIPSLREWGGASLQSISYSGSFAKGTAVTPGTDVDLFLSVRPSCDMSARDIYWSLYSFLDGRQLLPQTRDVGVSVRMHGLCVDLVPGRQHEQSTREHTLYRRKADTAVDTNVSEHAKFVTRSGLTQEIRAMKIWRARQKLAFPSFYLELTTIAALKESARGSTAKNFRTTLEYLANGFAETTVVDPANSNNIVSDDLTSDERHAVKRAAQKSLSTEKWEHSLW